MTPITPTEREPILDALRGFAVLGILIVNIEVMRSSEWFLAMATGFVAPASLPNRIVQFAVGWLASGKFLSSLAIFFGIGAALIAARALEAGESPRALLARRYAVLMAFGMGHMLLVPGDILFLYGVTGLAMLPFVLLPVRVLLWISAALLAAYSALSYWYWLMVYRAGAPRGGEESGADGFAVFVDRIREQTVTAYASGGWSDVLAAQAWQALLVQFSQVPAVPWALAMFLFGYALARAGLLSDLRGHRELIKVGAFVGLTLGLIASFGVGLIGPLAAFGAAPATEALWVTRWAAFGQIVGAPLLAVGYASALTLWFLRRGVPARLAAVGRMALTAYMLQSALTLAVFAGLRLYDRFSTVQALFIVAAIWGLLLVVCPLWLRRFQYGPAEWLWRSLTYGRAKPLRASSGVP